MRTSWLLALGWGFAAVLGAVSGMMVAPSVFLTPNMMQAILIYAFAAAVLGGLESPVGAVVGGLALGVTLNLLGTYVGFVGSTLQLPVALAVLLCVLVLRPAGLFGRADGETGMKRLGGPAGFALLVACVVLAPLVSSHYRTYQLGFVGIYLSALVGLNMLTGLTGQISLGHGAFMGIGAYTTAILVVDHGWRGIWTIPLAGLVAGAVGLAFGVPATRFAGPVPRARDVRDPAVVHRRAQEVPEVHRRHARARTCRSSTPSSG